MDPSGSVKEGEYATVQEYSQALLKRYGINVSRIFTSTGVLSPEARTAMDKTLTTKLDTSKSLYENLRTEYQRQMDAAYAGQPRQITNYTAAPSGMPKGSMTDRDFVEKALTSQNISYNQVISQTPSGTFPVVDNKEGKVWYVTLGEYSPSMYTKL
jgi:hypothetical protein